MLGKFIAGDFIAIAGEMRRFPASNENTVSDINFIASGVEFDLVPFILLIRFKCDISTRFTGSWCSMFGRKYRIKKKDNDWIIRLDTYRRFPR